MTIAARKIRLIMALRQAGITDTRVLSVIERLPREAFVPQPFHDQAYENRTLPIGSGQTMSTPEIVALMTQGLCLKSRHKVLEVGTGSGYHAAVLSRLARRVYTIERHKGLLVEAEQRFRLLRLHNITARLGDGSLGWKEQAPFDRIVVTAGAEQVPATLYEQLAVDGIMVLPLGPERSAQAVARITRTADGPLREDLARVVFVPLVVGQPRPGESVSAGPGERGLA